MISKVFFISCDDEDCEEIIDDPNKEYSQAGLIAQIKLAGWLVINGKHYCPKHHGSHVRTYKRRKKADNAESLADYLIKEELKAIGF